MMVYVFSKEGKKLIVVSVQKQEDLIHLVKF